MTNASFTRNRTILLVVLIVAFLAVTATAIILILRSGNIIFSQIIVVSGLTLLLPLVNFYFKRGNDSEEIELLREENRKIQQDLATNQNTGILETIQIQLNQVREYYI